MYYRKQSKILADNLNILVNNICELQLPDDFFADLCDKLTDCCNYCNHAEYELRKRQARYADYQKVEIEYDSSRRQIIVRPQAKPSKEMLRLFSDYDLMPYSTPQGTIYISPTFMPIKVAEAIGVALQRMGVELETY